MAKVSVKQAEKKLITFALNYPEGALNAPSIRQRQPAP